MLSSVPVSFSFFFYSVAFPFASHSPFSLSFFAWWPYFPAPGGPFRGLLPFGIFARGPMSGVSFSRRFAFNQWSPMPFFAPLETAALFVGADFVTYWCCFRFASFFFALDPGSRFSLFSPDFFLNILKFFRRPLFLAIQHEGFTIPRRLHSLPFRPPPWFFLSFF